ncbi:MAG: MgtC/SapB family protein [Candidatus Omnitrophica bacterium]|nr:MgtC/SapB family protein [Candidatus Omnitrophota bacterium]
MLTNYQILARLLFAIILSGLIGFEREYYGKAAGFRTHILVCVGSALMMMTSIHIFDIYRGIAAVDPGRIAAQVVTGMGFLGAGTIIRYGTTVKGLTTAASLWAVAGIGLAVGCGFYFAALATAIMVFVTLVIFSKMEEVIAARKKGGHEK